MSIVSTLLLAQLTLAPAAVAAAAAERFDGRYFSGEGDVEYLRLLDVARRMFSPDPEYQNAAMLYTPEWNGFVEGPTWDAWWIQNSYGTTYSALPFYDEPLITFLQNAQDLWFDQMGDGRTPRPFTQHTGATFDWIPPDGCLCDAASPGRFIAKQGDGRVDIHDWAFEFTAAGIIMQAEVLLISRDVKAIARYLPKLERCAAFIETRRDPKTNLFLVGPAANLLAPSYAGWKRPDGTYDRAYLAGLSVTYVAAMDRLIELCTLAGAPDRAALHRQNRETARKGLARLVTDEGYFIKSLDPDGTRHGVYGAEKHGYFEASPNHDAIAFRVVDDAQAQRIYRKIVSIAGLRPHDFIIANDPTLDDMYTEATGLWRFGHWVNGGHWSTCEARMILAYYRLGAFEDARRSMRQLMTFAQQFRMDNPLIDFGSKVYQPNEPINLCYDSFGPPAALIRGLFEYLYRADALTLMPHIPPGITRLEQHFPIRFGSKRIYLATRGSGKVTGALVNGEPWKAATADSVVLNYDKTPEVACVEILLGGAESIAPWSPGGRDTQREPAMAEALSADLTELDARANRMRNFESALCDAGLGQRYEAAHARLAADWMATIHARRWLQAAGKLSPLPEPSQVAADQAYIDTAVKLLDGLEAELKRYAQSDDPQEQTIHRLWIDCNK
ncbi:MAG: hypothetical protein JXA69_05235 [Phycisphaerae bacterium]|nr:hypothetical protein [Phycisphaerae bacterium]